MIGVPVVLHVKTKKQTNDALNNPTYTVSKVTVENVLVGQPETEELESSINLYGKKITYMLGIPKGDTHVWTDTVVEIFGEPYMTFGDVIQGIEENIPTPWHKKVRVMRCE